MATQYEQVLARIERYEKRVQNAFNAFLREFQTDTTLIAQINRELAINNMDGALNIVGDQFLKVANAPVSLFVEEATAATAFFGLVFDPTNPRATQIMRENRLLLIQQFNESQRAATSQALVRGLEEGAGPRQTARIFRESIGLTTNQEAAVTNYRRILNRQGKQLNEALTRELRDRRFDRTIRRQADLDGKLTPTQINKMVERYRERYLQYRSEAIARTETTRATSLARDEAARQMEEQTGRTVERKWNITRDARLRDAHSTMAGQKRTLDLPFIDGEGNALKFPGDPAAPAKTTIHCRCALTLSLK